MPLNLQRSIVRSAVVTTVVCLFISLGLSWLVGDGSPGLSQLGWPLALALGIGAFTGISALARVKKGILGALNTGMSYTPVDRSAFPDFDWASLDDYAAQLESRGFKREGDFTTFPASANSSGVAACFIDTPGSTLVEVQQIRLVGPDASRLQLPPGSTDVHFSIFSLLGGRAAITTTDRVPLAANFMMRCANDVVAAFPGTSLLDLLDKHMRLVSHSSGKSGLPVSEGLTLQRYILLQRERFAEAKNRISAESSLSLARQFDLFESAPQTAWAPRSAALSQLSVRPMEEVDRLATAHKRPPIVLSSASGNTGDRQLQDASVDESDSAALSPELAALRQRLESGASWFYWIAGLSAVNAVVALMGSDWGFAIGLGISQIFSGIAVELQKEAASSGLAAVTLWVLAFASIGFIACCGWLARRPSLAAFVAGMVVFGLDTLIFLVATDWIGLIFHALALYFLWTGFSAAREIARLRQNGRASAN